VGSARAVKTFQPRSAREWRAWLARNHASRDEVLLVFFRKEAGRPSPTYGEAVEEALCYGWIDGVKKRLDEQRYGYRFTPRRPRSRWSASNKRRVARLIAAGRMHDAGRAAVEVARANGAWDALPDAERQHEMPPELARVLARSATVRRFFDALPPGQRRNTIAWVASAKKVATRERRAAQAREAFRQGRRLW